MPKFKDLRVNDQVTMAAGSKYYVTAIKADRVYFSAYKGNEWKLSHVFLDYDDNLVPHNSHKIHYRSWTIVSINTIRINKSERANGFNLLGVA